jgi:hypothetical protein
MARTSAIFTPPSGSFPDELLAAITLEAEADAERVAAFVRQLGIESSPESPFSASADLLLFLGAVLRLASWEESGLRIHLDAGLPTAVAAFVDAFHSVVKQGKPTVGRDLSNAVLALFIERFAWHGRSDWDAAIVLDSFDEDTALDALAELLWRGNMVELGGKG